MSDLISRQAAIDAVCMDWCGDKHSECRHANDEYDWCDGCETVHQLTNLPTVTESKVIAEVKVDMDEIMERVMDAVTRTLYCQNCGARIKGVNDEKL